MFNGKLINPNKLSNEDLIKLLNFKTMNIDQLIDLRVRIINEMEERKKDVLMLPKEYKSFSLYDYSEAQPHITEIKFIIDSENSLYGVDEDMNFYIGKATRGVCTGLYLLKFVNDPSITIYTSSNGFISKNFKRYWGDYWRTSNGKVCKHLNKIENINRQTDDSLISVYDKIIDEKIENIDILISSAYLKLLKTYSNLPNIVDVVTDKYYKLSIKNK